MIGEIRSGSQHERNTSIVDDGAGRGHAVGGRDQGVGELGEDRSSLRIGEGAGGRGRSIGVLRAGHQITGWSARVSTM